MHRLASISELANLTGKSWRTIERRLAGVEPAKRTGRAALYATPAALAAIYVPDGLRVGELDLATERAALARAQREALERRAAVECGELARKADVQRFWTDCIAAARAKFLQIPGRLGAVAPAAAEPCRRLIHEALTALTEYEPGE